IAMLRPIPLPAPVTTATRPLKSKSACFMRPLSRSQAPSGNALAPAIGVDLRGSVGGHEAFGEVAVDLLAAALHGIAIASAATALDPALVAFAQAHVGKFGGAFGAEGVPERHEFALPGPLHGDAGRRARQPAAKRPRPGLGVVHQHAH